MNVNKQLHKETILCYVFQNRMADKLLVKVIIAKLPPSRVVSQNRKGRRNIGKRERTWTEKMEKLHTKILKYLVPHHHHVHQISIRKIRMVLGTHFVYR